MADIDIDKLTDEEVNDMVPPEVTEDTEPAVKEEEPSSTPTEQEPEAKENVEDSEPAPEGEEDSENSSDQSDYKMLKQFHDSIMAPIKANGKTFQPRSDAEAIRLMQMGANYTQKMQSIAPYRRHIQTLKNAGLCDESKINFLIDVAQGNPEAIKKILKDNKLDPLDFNIDDEPKYIPGNHTVSEEQLKLQTVVEDLKSTPVGIETLNIIQGWDHASLNEIGQDPSIMTTLNEQRQNGVFDFLSKEIDHQRMLGNIPEGTSFLDAYKMVGDYYIQQLQAQQQQQMYQNLPSGMLNNATSPAVNNQIRGVAPTGRAKKTTTTFVDPFTLSDEEFEKEFKNYAN